MNTQRIIERIESWTEKQTDSYVRDAYLQCLSIIKEEIEQSNWQPIETAPKDGQVILGAYYYKSIGWEISSVEWCNGWSLIVRGSYAEDGDWNPTHWMPLPNPPTVNHTKFQEPQVKQEPIISEESIRHLKKIAENYIKIGDGSYNYLHKMIETYENTRSEI